MNGLIDVPVYSERTSIKETLNAICTSQPLPPSSTLARRDAKDAARRRGKIKSRLNQAIDAIVLKALHKQREHRYQNAGELGQDILAYLEGRPISASPSRPVHPIWKHPAFILSIFAGLAALTPLAIISARHFQSAQPLVETKLTQPNSTRGQIVVPDEPAWSPNSQTVSNNLFIGSTDAAKLQEDVAKSEGRPLTVTNSLGMELVFIPKGTFSMGGGERQPLLIHHVTLSKSFMMGATSVSDKQWQRLMNVDHTMFKGDNLPVLGVDWFEATEFCKKLSAAENRTYRLPTEAEWEYAACTGEPYNPSVGAITDQYMRMFEDVSWCITNSNRLRQEDGGTIINGGMMARSWSHSKPYASEASQNRASGPMAHDFAAQTVRCVEFRYRNHVT